MSAKHGVVGLVKTLALEGAARGSSRPPSAPASSAPRSSRGRSTIRPQRARAAARAGARGRDPRPARREAPDRARGGRRDGRLPARPGRAGVHRDRGRDGARLDRPLREPSAPTEPSLAIPDRAGGCLVPTFRQMRVCLMIEGQEGVTWEQWRALACAAEGVGPRGAVPLRPLPLDPSRRAGGLARRVGDARRDRRGDRPDPARDDGLAGHVPAGRRCSRRTRSPSTTSPAAGSSSGSAPAGTRPSTRSTASPSAAHGRALRRARPPARRDPPPVGRRERSVAEAGAAPAAADHRRRRGEAALGARRGRASPTSTTRPSRRVEDARARRRVVDDAAREAGREPLVFSMMCGCVVGRDRAERGRPARPLARDHPPARELPDAVRDGRRGRRAPARLRGGGRRARDAPAPGPRGPRDGRASSATSQRPFAEDGSHGFRGRAGAGRCSVTTSAKRPRRRTRLCTTPGAGLPSGPDGPCTGRVLLRDRRATGGRAPASRSAATISCSERPSRCIRSIIDSIWCCSLSLRACNRLTSVVS